MTRPAAVPDLPTISPAIATAALPATYEAARNAIAECDRIDECKTWADKAAALASYARQAKDDSLAVYARRIQARALRRAGELLKAVPRGDVATRFGQEGDHPPAPTRTQVADEAGISKHQRKQALRVAAVPAEEFDYALESQAPPTVTELATLGTQSRPRPLDEPIEPTSAGRADVLETAKAIYEFSQFCDRVDPVKVAMSLLLEHAHESRAEVSTIQSWLERFVTSLPK